MAVSFGSGDAVSLTAEFPADSREQAMITGCALLGVRLVKLANRLATLEHAQ